MINTQIYILSNNTLGLKGFGSEHGLSMLIILNQETYWLWDTGQSSLFKESAEKFGFDLKKLNGVALSHGHYDHTGGLSTLFNEIGFNGPIYAHSDVAVNRFKIKKGATPKTIGLNKDVLPWPLAGFVGISNAFDLTNGLTMISNIPRRSGFHQFVDGFFFDDQKRVPDRVKDDACLVLSSAPGPVLILGCCHSGLANTLYQVRDLLGINRIFSVVGGMHLINAPESGLNETIQVLKEFSVRQIYPCHCTGEKATRFLKERLPGRVFDIGTGTVIEF